jgi:hypothetical protein
MRRLWAALGAAILTSCSGAASATIATLQMSGEYISASGPAGYFDQYIVGAWNPVTHDGPKDYISFGLGGIGWDVTITYDSTKGILTDYYIGTYLIENFSPSEWSGVLHAFDQTINLNTASSVGIGFDPYGPTFSATGIGYSFYDDFTRYDYPFGTIVGSVFSPFSAAGSSVPGRGGEFTSDMFYGYFSIDNYASITIDSPIPEPGAWALMLTGFAGLGAALRRERERVITGSLGERSA